MARQLALRQPVKLLVERTEQRPGSRALAALGFRNECGDGLIHAVAPPDHRVAVLSGEMARAISTCFLPEQTSEQLRVERVLFFYTNRAFRRKRSRCYLSLVG
jgi:hypothetical protein